MSQFVYIPESDIWTDKVRMVQTKDPVLGGKDGPANWAAQDLTNRTLFLKKAVEAAQTSANAANTAAKNADTKADTAQTTANQAKTAATNAQKTADDAKSAAATADGKAVAAQTSANAANTAAKNADTKAGTAQTTANQAKSAAATADAKAVAAQTSANVAKEKADLVGIQANNNAKEIEKKADKLQVKNEFLTNAGTYTNATRDAPVLVAGNNGLAQAGSFLKNNPGVDFTGVIPSSTWLYYEIQSNYSVDNLVATFKGYNSPILLQATKRAGADWSKPIVFADASNVLKAGDFGYGGRSADIGDLVGRDFNNLPILTQVFTVSGAWVNSPFSNGSIAITGTCETVARAFNAGMVLTVRLHANGKHFERDFIDGIWSGWRVPMSVGDFGVGGQLSLTGNIFDKEFSGFYRDQSATLYPTSSNINALSVGYSKDRMNGIMFQAASLDAWIYESATRKTAKIITSASLTQTTGTSTTAAMSQDGITKAIDAKAGIKLGEEQVTPGGYGGYGRVPENCVITKVSGLYEGGGNIGGVAYYRPIIQL